MSLKIGDLDLEAKLEFKLVKFLLKIVQNGTLWNLNIQLKNFCHFCLKLITIEVLEFYLKT